MTEHTEKNTSEMHEDRSTQTEANTNTSQEGSTTSESFPQQDNTPDYKEQYLRLYAEFDNYKKRTQKEKADWIQMSNKEMMLAMIDILDDCLRAEEELKKNLASEHPIGRKDIEGVLLIFSKLNNNLTQKGLAHIQALDKAFDINEHEAIAEVETPDEKKGKVIAEAQRGYTLNGKVIKFAKVVVGK